MKKKFSSNRMKLEPIPCSPNGGNGPKIGVAYCVETAQRIRKNSKCLFISFFFRYFAA